MVPRSLNGAADYLAANGFCWLLSAIERQRFFFTGMEPFIWGGVGCASLECSHQSSLSCQHGLSARNVAAQGTLLHNNGNATVGSLLPVELTGLIT